MLTARAGLFVAAVAVVVASSAGAQDGGVSEAPPGDSGLVAKGEQLYKQNACFACHSLDGTKLAAPSFEGMYGKSQKLQDGTTVTVDDAFIRESIKTPGAKVAAGYLPTMPNYTGRLSDDDIDALIAFIKSLR